MKRHISIHLREHNAIPTEPNGNEQCLCPIVHPAKTKGVTLDQIHTPANWNPTSTHTYLSGSIGLK